MQFDAQLQLNDLSSPKKIQQHCTHHAADFPDVIREIVESNDYATNYLWRSTDFNLLEHFHKGNVGLIGDAAHVALPFTSAGVANALMDAKTMAACLNHYDNPERAFKKFYALRHHALDEHVKLGRIIQQNFLSGTYVGAVIPLIKQLESSTSRK
jgi:2-polyprenyl-6-methoxyphenol hydroxylase-like FAD-dependent oxidoreductase